MATARLAALALSCFLPLASAAAPSCEAAAAAAERDAAIPPGLLAAIGRVESGRRNPATGQRDIWPWTVNVNGQGAMFATAGEAVSYVSALLDAGARSIDVGCFQVNLQWHPGAFASLAEAFDPAANARYAASFLTALRGSEPDWLGAIARYHSRSQALGEPYRALVLTAWASRPAGPGLADVGDAVVVRMSGAAKGVHVWYGAIPLRP